MNIGDKVPNLTIRDHKGNELQIAELYSNGSLVLFFYPKNNTMVCTQEACSFRDNYDSFLELGASVLGVSADSDLSHSDFASKHGLPFHLVSDENGEIRKAFGIASFLGIMPDRATFVIDSSGEVREIVRAKFSASAHIDQSLALVREIQQSKV